MKNMRWITKSMVLPTLLAVSVFTSCDKDEDNTTPNDLVNVATTNGLTSLVSAVNAAGLTSTLQGTGPFTVFAPTNAAFSALPAAPADLKNTLLYHVLGGNIASGAVPTTLTGVVTANDAKDSVYVRRIGSNVYINGVKVDLADVTATNGVAHVIGSVLIPPTGNIVQTAVAAKFDSLAKAVTLASTGAGSEDLLTALANTKGLTVFAPTNQAFTNLLTALGVSSIDAIPKATLIAVLKYHVIGARVFSSDLTEGAKPGTLQGGTLTVSLASGAKVLGNGNGTNASAITAANIMAKNGVIHVIDRVLIP